MTHDNPHHITVDDVTEPVRIEVDGAVVAESSRALVLREGTITPRYYLPREDVKSELLVESDLSTTCPFKGNASYWSLILDDKRYDGLVWSYQEPIPGMEPIAGLLSFFNERVDVFVGGELQS
jgi:uncharacterized protein (DUF427 family)